MCYDKKVGTKLEVDYARIYGTTPTEIEHYRKELEEGLKAKSYYQSGFDHSLNPVITNDQPKDIQFYQWGLMPWFSKTPQDAVISARKCLNARGETIFDKPSFREPALKKRCLVTCVDGFYEHFHFGKQTYPFFIYRKDDKPMTFAGLWDVWKDPDGVKRHSYSIVTTKANKLLTRIHNNPKSESAESRIPVILPEELMWDWLNPINDQADKDLIRSLIQTYPDENLTAHPVRKLKGNAGTGNKPIASEPFEYPELALAF